MALDRDAFIKNYLEEVNENIEKLTRSFGLLDENSENPDLLKKVLRIIHSVKGASRMLGFRNMEKIAHGIEDVFKGVSEKRFSVNYEIIKLTFIALDYLSAGAKKIKVDRDDILPADKLLETLNRAASNEPFSVKDASMDRYAEDDPEHKGESTVSEFNQDTVRINISTVDKILKRLNGLIIHQFQFKRENEKMINLETKLREIYDSLEKNKVPSRIKTNMEDCLENVSSMKKDFQQELPQIEREAFEVQGNILRLRMLPINLITGPLARITADLSSKLEKKVSIKTEGDQILIDKVILEHIYDPLIHLVRNAVDHGIETPAVRAKAGKSEEGQIVVSAVKEGSNISVIVKDDGKGIDYSRLRKKVIERYPDRADEIREMDESSLNVFLFESGFSTKKKATDISGRGVGLDVVKSNIEEIKGKITLDSSLEDGTSFEMMLPLSLSTVEGFFIKSSVNKFLITSNFVKEVIMINTADVVDLISKKAFKLRGEMIMFYNLASLFGEYQGEKAKDQFMVIVEAFGETVGIAVDSVLRFSSLVHKPLPKNLETVSAVQGIVFDEKFDIVPILHVPELIHRFKRLKNIDLRKKYSSTEKEYKRILIVDDSSSTREIIKSIVEMEDYRADTAVDGIDALEKTDARYYHLIITDYMMPRMDGLTFVNNLRKKEKYKTTPVIALSSADRFEVREQFSEFKVDCFIVKSQFEREVLVDEIKVLLSPKSR